MTTGAPNSLHTAAMRESSVATMTSRRDLAPLAPSHTHWIMARPEIGARTLPGKRVEAHRAGMIPTAVAMPAMLPETLASRLRSQVHYSVASDAEPVGERGSDRGDGEGTGKGMDARRVRDEQEMSTG